MAPERARIDAPIGARAAAAISAVAAVGVCAVYRLADVAEVILVLAGVLAGLARRALSLVSAKVISCDAATETISGTARVRMESGKLQI